jgi:tRNA U34 5-methylaminomethyl-2-thiouridine-forming methyltransferase MnmC
MMEKDGVFVTYSSRGSVRRGLIASGFHVEKIPGPAGKREMVRAHKK